MRIGISGVLLALGTVACVPKAQLVALQNTLHATQADLAAQLEATTERVDACEASLEDCRGQLAARTAMVSELEGRNATLIKDKSQLDASVAEMQSALQELQERKTAADARIAEFQSLLSKLQSLIDSGRLKVKMVQGRMVVELASDILFSSGSAQLSPEGEASLREVAVALASIPDRHFQVEGHTDDDPISTERFPSNWELGSARAITVVQTLQQGGVKATRLSGASYAESRPVAPNKSDSGKAANRRIEIVVVPDLSLLPGYDELGALSAGE